MQINAFPLIHDTTPACTTLHSLFANQDHAAFESALATDEGKWG